jgi:hypothetical protein
MIRIIFITGLAISMMAGPFSVTAAGPQQVVITRTDQAALTWEYPGIRITNDQLSTTLYKQLTRPYYLSGQAHAEGVKLSAADSAYLRNINRWKAVRYKAALYDSAIVHDVSQGISAGDIRKYYDTHPAEYKRYAVATYIQAAIHPGHEGDSVTLIQDLRSLSRKGIDKGSFKKDANEKWAINMEQDVVITPSMPSYPALSHTQKGAVTFHLNGKALTYYLIVAYQPETAIPMDTVRGQIISAIIRQRLESNYAQVTHNADSIVPLRLDTKVLHDLPGKEPNAKYGTIGGDTISNAFMAAVQMVDPRFHFSNRADDFSVLLHSYVSIPQAKARMLKKISKQDSLILDRILWYTYEFALADKYAKAHKEQLSNVPESEIVSYYQSHQNLYTQYGLCSYLKAEVIDSSPVTIALAQKDMLAVNTKLPIEKIKVAGKYTITSETDRRYDPSHELYLTIRNTPLRSVSGPVRSMPDAAPLLILPYRKDEPQPKPLAKVRENCRQAIANEKLEAYNERMKAEVFGKYTFVIE